MVSTLVAQYVIPVELSNDTPWPSIILMVLKVACIAVVVALTVFSATIVYKCGCRTLELQFADDQIGFLLSVEDSASKGDFEAALIGLSEAVHYYPSGTKQKSGSIADRIVERVRAHTVRHIIARLEELTGKDLGDDPDTWLKQGRG